MNEIMDMDQITDHRERQRDHIPVKVTGSREQKERTTQSRRLFNEDLKKKKKPADIAVDESGPYKNKQGWQNPYTMRH